MALPPAPRASPPERERSATYLNMGAGPVRVLRVGEALPWTALVTAHDYHDASVRTLQSRRHRSVTGAASLGSKAAAGRSRFAKERAMPSAAYVAARTRVR